jgi:hypothetical protein
MAEIEALSVQPSRRLNFGWLVSVLVKPRQTFDRVRETGQNSYLTPLLVISLFALIAILVAAPIRRQAAAGGVVQYPPDYQYWSPEMQAQFEAGINAGTGPAFTYIFPAISALAGIWLGWLFLSAVLHLSLTISGSRSSFSSVMNVVAWASVPLILRYIVQIISMLATHRLITSPGLMGFAAVGDTSMVQYIASVLPLIDLYLIWQVVLIMVGVKPLSGLSTGKVITSVLIAMIISLAVFALPGFAGKKLGGLSVIRPFMF